MQESIIRDYEEWVKFDIRIKKLSVKQTVINHYSHGSMCCEKCGCSNFKKLVLHHSNFDGAVWRKQTGLSGLSFYKFLIKNNFPNNLGLRVYCIACNSSEKCF